MRHQQQAAASHSVYCTIDGSTVTQTQLLEAVQPCKLYRGHLLVLSAVTISNALAY